jgi:4-amino-4-deoxy-L-arabinose transferase-like glycosyltransferase
MSEENAGASAQPSSEPAQGSENTRQLPLPVERGRQIRSLLAWFTVCVAALSLFMPLAASGIWDPPEREVAELSRRIALNLLGGHELAVDGANNDVPTRAELGRGELPFTSIAVGFRAFGLHEWAGRLPLALWGVIGLAATFLLVRRLADPRAAWLSVLVLVTMPLYFLHARTMLGDIVTMAAVAVSLAGLGLAVFERGAEGRVGRVLAVGLGGLGMLCAVLSRGVLIGIAVPALSVGLSWLLLRASKVSSREPFGDALGGATLALGVGAALVGIHALVRAPASGGAFTLLLGSVVNRPHVLPTFDSVISQLAHALFPWSALLPVALGTLLGEPHVAPGPARERQAALRALVLVTPVIALLAYGVAAPVLGTMPFAAVPLLAIAPALFVRDFERGAVPLRALPMVACAFALLLLVDFTNLPDKALSAFCVGEVRVPQSFKPIAQRFLEAGTLICCGAFFFLLQERSTHQDTRFDAEEYRRWPRAFRELWAGNLQFVVVVLEVALIGVCILGYLSDHVPAVGNLDALGAAPRWAASRGAFALPLAVLAPTLLLLVRDSFRTLFDPELGTLFGSGSVSRFFSGGLSRAQAAVFVCALFGLSLSLGFYPLLAAQISPKQVFDTYRQEARPGEPLGMLGAGAAGATYYAGRNVPSFDAPARAFDWLMSAGERRWLVLGQQDLAELNALYRAHQRPARNLPVFDSGSSEILLAASQLTGLHNDNPLARYLPDAEPRPSHAMSANLGDKLDVLGWDTLDLDGQVVRAVEAGRHYTFIIYFRVVQPIAGNWQTFIHIDGFQRRFNGDHPTLDGKYPFNLWHVGDFIADRCDFVLEPNFGPGKYRVYFGLYSGNRRLEVRRGTAEENRLDGGFVEVR